MDWECLLNRSKYSVLYLKRQGCYRAVTLLEHGMKVVERVLQKGFVDSDR